MLHPVTCKNCLSPISYELVLTAVVTIYDDLDAESYAKPLF